VLYVKVRSTSTSFTGSDQKHKKVYLNIVFDVWTSIGRRLRALRRTEYLCCLVQCWSYCEIFTSRGWYKTSPFYVCRQVLSRLKVKMSGMLPGWNSDTGDADIRDTVGDTSQVNWFWVSLGGWELNTVEQKCFFPNNEAVLWMALPPSVPSTHHSHQPSPLYSFTPGLKLSFSANLSHHSLHCTFSSLRFCWSGICWTIYCVRSVSHCSVLGYCWTFTIL